MRNQTSFRLTTTLLPTDTSAKTTDVINKVDSCGCKFKPTFTEETVVLTNDDRTVMETTRAYSCNGAICFTKRGLSDDVSETEVANRKLTWNPGSLAFVTAGAADWIDKDDDIVWTGNQTYTGTLTSCCCATYCGDATYKGTLTTEKGVKYPNFANVTCLQAYASPYGGMFATVDDTGELYRYNAVTCCWDMVSSVALGTYEIRCSATRPDACTGSTIVTISPEKREIYVGTKGVVVDTHVDALLVGGGGGGGGGNSNKHYFGGGGGGGEVVLCNNYLVYGNSLCVEVGSGGTGGNCGVSGGSGGNSKFARVLAHGGGGGGAGAANICNGCASIGGSGGGGGLRDCCCGAGGSGYSNALIGGRNGGATRYCNSAWFGGKGGSAIAVGGDGTGVQGGLILNFHGIKCEYSQGGGGGYICTYSSDCQPSAGSSSSCYGGGGGGGTCCVCGKVGHAGIVMIAYPTDGSYGISCATGGTVTCCDGYTIHTFTSNGTFCIVS